MTAREIIDAHTDRHPRSVWWFTFVLYLDRQDLIGIFIHDQTLWNVYKQCIERLDRIAPLHSVKINKITNSKSRAKGMSYFRRHYPYTRFLALLVRSNYLPISPDRFKRALCDIMGGV